MSITSLPVWVTFVVTIIVVVLAVEAGFRLGRQGWLRSEDEKEQPVSVIAEAILTLAGFMLAFTFGISSDRLQDRKVLVREEANAIATAWLRSDFLPEPDRAQAKGLLQKYVDDRLDAAQAHDFDQLQKKIDEAARIQRQLWDMAVKNALKDMNSDVYALYIESLNKIIDIHALRIAVALYPQIPFISWLVLYTLVILGMLTIGYETAITGGARRSRAASLLAVSFSLVIALIVMLDRPQSDIIKVPQQPLIDLREAMIVGSKLAQTLDINR
jgi:hypothetical protein